jgi:hypothetical protein
MNEQWQAYWDKFADAFVHPLKCNSLLGKFITNQCVTGAYAEACVKSLAITMLPQFRMSTGAVISPSDWTKDLQKLPQCDLIIWNPSDVPAIFEKGDFALVPNLSARAIIEVKRSVNDLDRFAAQLKRRKECLLPEFNVLGVVVSHNKSLFDHADLMNWPKDEKWKKEPAMTRLLAEEDSNKPDTDGVFALISLLSHVAKQFWRTGDAPWSFVKGSAP